MTKRIATASMLTAALVFGLSTTLSAQTPAPPPRAVVPVADAALPADPRRATLLKVCSGCHAVDVVAQQRLTAEGWHDLVEKMADNGALGSETEFAEITGYLVKNFSAKPGQ